MARERKRIEETPGIRELPPANYARLIYGDGDARIESNGEIAALEINYRGAFHGRKRLGKGWSIKANRNKILIISLAQTPISELLFQYVGRFEIVSCKFVTWGGVMKYAKVENTHRGKWSDSKGNWGADGRKYEEIEEKDFIYKTVLKTRI